MVPTKIKRPLLRYHGGKFLLARWIVSYMPSHRVYVEPFGGAASVLLHKPRSYAEIYNDLDGEIVNLFRVVRETGNELRHLLELTPFSRSEFECSYEPSHDPLEQARRTIVRSFMGFGSNAHNKITGFRSNSNRSGTTGAHDWRNYPAARGSIIERLQGVCLECRGATEVMLAHDGGATLHYIDAPYPLAVRGKGTHYRHEMTDADHRALSESLRSLKGMVMLSGYPCELFDELYSDWHHVERSALADGALPRIESLWFNPAAEQGLPQGILWGAHE